MKTINLSPEEREDERLEYQKSEYHMDNEEPDEPDCDCVTATERAELVEREMGDIGRR